MANFRVGVLTGGGDTAALNATLRGITDYVHSVNGEVIGFLRGWAGPLLPDKEYIVNGKPLDTRTGEYVILRPQDIPGERGGSILYSSRTNLAEIEGGFDDLARRVKDLRIDFMLPIGGDDTTTVALKVLKEGILDIPLLTVPKTIDNDNGRSGMFDPMTGFYDFGKMTNYWTHGFPTAVQRGVEFLESITTTTVTHERVMFVEAMGRKPGWLALAVGELGNADMIIIPEHPVAIEEICRRALEIYKDKGYFLGVVAEGAKDVQTGKPLSQNPAQLDAFGHAKLGGVAELLAAAAQRYFKVNGHSAPYFNGQSPGYFYRGGNPLGSDRINAHDAGSYAAHALATSPTEVNGHMVVLMRDRDKKWNETLPLEEAVQIGDDGKIVPRLVPVDLSNPENGFYNPVTMQATQLGRNYAASLGAIYSREKFPTLHKMRIRT